MSEPSATPLPAASGRRTLAVRIALLSLIGLFGVWLVVQGILAIHPVHVSVASVGVTDYERAIAGIVIGVLFVVVDLALIVFVLVIRPRIARTRAGADVDGTS